MPNNLNAGYGRLIAQSATPKGTGKTFYVTASSGKTADFLQEVFQPDEGIIRVYSTLTLALAQCVTGRGDSIIIAPDYTTAPTDTELGSAGAKGVRISFANQGEDDEEITMTSNRTLPATTTGVLFNVVGVVEVIAIIGIVTTVIQTQTCNMKLSTVSNSATTDVCANLDITAAAVQDRFSITGTFANAMIKTAKGVPVARQATSFIAQEGTIIATTSATNTGAVRWLVRYKPLQEGARIYAS